MVGTRASTYICLSVRKGAMPAPPPCLENSMHKTYPVSHTEEEWRRILTPEQYSIMRQHGTERPGSCALLHEKRPGRFLCVGCDSPLFESTLKFESGTGWPSFN